MCRHPVEGHETEDPSQDGWYKLEFSTTKC